MSRLRCLVLVAALVTAALIATPAADAAPAHSSARHRVDVCSQAFPDAHRKTIGRTTWWNRQGSVWHVVCGGFGRNPSAEFTTDGIACGLTATAIGTRYDRLGLFVDGACSGASLAADPRAPAKYLEI